ncbi:MAG: hypothetical protein JWO47_539 [Candidatus Saccharibacteria bacterium]|nr:hypothetical protein [Candidatus Saccharibacteria bacterium]
MYTSGNSSDSYVRTNKDYLDPGVKLQPIKGKDSRNVRGHEGRGVVMLTMTAILALGGYIGVKKLRYDELQDCTFSPNTEVVTIDYSQNVEKAARQIVGIVNGSNACLIEAEAVIQADNAALDLQPDVQMSGPTDVIIPDAVTVRPSFAGYILGG